MRMTSYLAASTFVLTAAFSHAQAAPAFGDHHPVGGRSIIKAQGDDCHADVRLHYLPEFDRSLEHKHRSSDCLPVIVEEDVAPVSDCHRDPERHLLPEIGREVWHRHAGPNCLVETFQERDEGTATEGCLKAGPVTICP